MSFDVGQRVGTPNGEAFVVSCDAQADYVTTDRGTYPHEDVVPFVDVKALRDPEKLEAWLEEGEDPSRPVESVIVYCRCTCGQDDKGCYRVEHTDQATGIVVSRGFPHTTASGACRCAFSGCDCIREFFGD